MPHLKSRTSHPPYSFRFLQPEAGQTEEFVGSFNHVVEQVIRLRNANPFLCERHGWSTDVGAVETEVDAYNTARCIAGGWMDFVVMEDGNNAPLYVMPAQKKTPKGGFFKSVAASGSHIAAGIGLLYDWIGPTAKAVPQELSEQRAATCVACPLNGKGGVLDFFVAEAAKVIHTQLQMRTEMELKTSLDSQLGICKACSCWNPLKVHVPMEFIMARMPDDVRGKLDENCWIRMGT